MNPNARQMTIRSLFMVIFVVVAIAISYLKPLDAYANAYHDQALKQAALTYATARGINALVSMLQSSTIEGGAVIVSGSVTIGELLDPVNDLIERFSSVMTIALASLAAQKLLLVISGQNAFLHILLASGIALLLCIRLQKPMLFQWMLKFFMVTVFLRFTMVLVLGLNAVVDRGFLWHETDKHDQSVQVFQSEIGPDSGEASVLSPAEAGDAGDYAMKTTDWIAQLNFAELEQKVEKSIDDFIMLMAIYLLKTIVLPILFLYGFVFVLRKLWSLDLHDWPGRAAGES